MTPGAGADRAGGRRAGRQDLHGQARQRPGRSSGSTSSRSGSINGLIKTDATALLRPRTPLKDMYLQVFPGERDGGTPIKKDFNLPLRNTLTDVNLDEILSALDGRTRDYLTLLLNGTADRAQGPRRRPGGGLQAASSRPSSDLGRVNRAVSSERGSLRRLIASTGRLNGELAKRPDQISQPGLHGEHHLRRVRLRGRRTSARRSPNCPPRSGRRPRPSSEVKPAGQRARPGRRGPSPRPSRRSTAATGACGPRPGSSPRSSAPRCVPFTREPHVRSSATSSPTATSLSKLSPELQRSAKVLNSVLQHGSLSTRTAARARDEARPGRGLPVLARLDHPPGLQSHQRRRRERALPSRSS